ncbi:hypothetical protein LWI28_023377 [Acer negundo]|uniref:Uncharacterized protein n=1 Tax=Acer negundo TaxID=4023 RepID=A0AAD5IMV2_ACENE|nr:hypothetical protein LWI28_023377 [Acer negundo]
MGRACFTLVNNWNYTKNCWRIVKDVYKDKDINLEVFEKDYNHAFATMHFGKEFLDYDESSNVDRASSLFQNLKTILHLLPRGWVTIVTTVMIVTIMMIVISMKNIDPPLSSNADQASSSFQKSQDYFASVTKGIGYYSDYNDDRNIIVLYVLLRVLQSSSGFNSCTKKQKRLMVVWLGFAGGGVSKEKKKIKSTPA